MKTPPESSPEVLVIGAGSAGHAAASTAAKLGATVWLADDAGHVGGLCILRGCMPTKALIETADRLRDLREADRFGIREASGTLDVAALRERVKSLVEEFRQGRCDEAAVAGYRQVNAKARFLSREEVELEGHGVIRPGAVILATGSSPVIPDLPGLAGTPYWTSDDVVDLPSLPPRIAVVGSGAVGMECAHLFEGLGSAVTIIARGDRLIGKADPELSAALLAAGEDRGIRHFLSTRVMSVKHRDGVFTLSLDHGDPLEVDALLIATGRRPATGTLGLDSVGVATNDGLIVIDEHARSSVPGIYAAGDCASPIPVVHLAVAQGEVAARHAVQHVKGGPRPEATWSRDTAMMGWFTHPQSAQVGLDEEMAAKRGIEVVTSRHDYDDHGKGIIVGSRHGFVKVIATRENRRLIGAVAVGPEVVETAHLLQAAIHLRLTAAEYIAIPHFHPTLAEAWSRAVEGVVPDQEESGT